MSHTFPPPSSNIRATSQTDHFTKIDFIYWGNLILDKALRINETINKELLRPIAEWLNEPEWLKQFTFKESAEYNWADYKKRARQLTQQERFLKAERLRRYWQELRCTKNLREEVRALLTSNKSIKKDEHLTLTGTGFNRSAFPEICKPFSPEALTLRHCEFEFNRFEAYPLSLSLPWKTILATELAELDTEEILFSELEQHCPKNSKRSETVIKFQTLLDMDNQDEIKLSQNMHLGAINIENNPTSDNTVFSVKERSGNSCHLDWRLLSLRQRRYVVQDLLTNKIILTLTRQDAA